MQILQEDLIKIVEQASTISERLGAKFIPNSASNDDAINFRLQNWRQTVAQGNQAQFEKRLAWDDLNLNTIRPLLGSVCLAEPQHLPAWIETLKAVLETTKLCSLETLTKGILQEENNILNSQKPLPFEELFLPFIYVARQKLIADTSSCYSLVSEEAHTTLERSLLESLTHLCSQAMGINFQVFQIFEQPKLIRRLGQILGSDSRGQYINFIRKMQEGELLAFFQEYAVLARLAATVTDFWIDATNEFLQRLAADRLDIQKSFQVNAELGQVVTIHAGLSDLHENGRSVIAITFASGLKLIYKPKDLGLEEAYFQLLNWFNERGIPLPFKLLQVVNRSTYGWVEYVEHLPCPDQLAAVRYYQRAGMLLCLLYALNGTDCHSENIIACGEYPVAIDLEMLLSHRVRDVGDSGFDTGASYMANQQVMDSVLHTSFLPKWQLGPDGLAYDVSALAGAGEQQTHFRILRWKNINTDGMVLGYEYGKTQPNANGISLDGVNLSPSDYVEEIVDGFRQMYQFLVSHREALLAANSPIGRLNHQRVRFLFRFTQAYNSLIKESLQPKFLRDGADFSITLDALSKSLLKSKTKPSCWSIVAIEKQALVQLDIPMLATRSDSDDLILSSNQTVKQYFTQPSYNLVIDRLQKFSENDLQQQICFIRGSLYTRTKSETDRPLPPSEPRALNLDTVSPLTQEKLVQKAVGIAYELQERAMSAPDGSVIWMGLEYIPESQRFQHQPMSYDLYDGSYGVALFLAALKKITGAEEFGDLALRALQPFCKVLQDLDVEEQLQSTKHLGIGGGKGLGSIVYALVRVSQFLEDPIFLEEAQKVVSLITPERIDADQKFDILSGTAGTILGLLTLHSSTADPAVLDQAISCGHHLLNNRTVSNAGPRAWATINGKLLTGLSHGTAGIAYALLRLYETTQNLAFREAACEAIAYERSVFSQAVQNWPDFRSENTVFGASWCHGAPGIALARLGSLTILDTKEIRQEIEIALQTTQKLNLQEINHLCCGNFGRIDTLLVAAHQLECPEFLKLAHQQAAWIVNRAENAGSFQMFPTVFKDIYNPGFFQGTSGIGYELLRLAYPEKLPSVLLWQ